MRVQETGCKKGTPPVWPRIRGIVSYFWITDPNAGGTLTEIILKSIYCGETDTDY